MLALGGEAFRLVTGLSVDIYKARGYWYGAKDCVPSFRKSWEPVGTYKSTPKCSKCRGRGFTGEPVNGILSDCEACKGVGSNHNKGDLKYGWVQKKWPPSINNSVEWIFATFDPEFVIKDKMRSYVAFKSDVMRVQRALNGGVPEDCVWTRR